MEVRLQCCETYDLETCREALRQVVGDLSWVKPGMKIGIKANLLSAMEPEKAGTTHPALLTALTELLLERGAAVVIGDSPGGLYHSTHLEKVYTACGLSVVALAAALVSPVIAYYAMWALAIAAFGLTVYYTVKQL